MARLRVLVSDFDYISEQMGPAFRRYNADGLLIESFVQFSTKLWLAAERILKDQAFFRS